MSTHLFDMKMTTNFKGHKKEIWDICLTAWWLMMHDFLDFYINPDDIIHVSTTLRLLNKDLFQNYTKL